MDDEFVFMECCHDCFYANKAKIKQGYPYCEFPGSIDDYIDHDKNVCSKSKFYDSEHRNKIIT